jgi:hypothetical protein
LLALATIYDGGSRSDAARIASVTLQIVRDWVLRFNTHGPDGLVNGKAPGGRAKLELLRLSAKRWISSLMSDVDSMKLRFTAVATVQNVLKLDSSGRFRDFRRCSEQGCEASLRAYSGRLTA